MKSWKNKIGVLAMIVAMATMLAACGAPSSEKLFSSFEQAASTESAASAAFEELKQLESKDQKQYDRILDKGERSNVNVQTLITQTMSSLDQRQQAMMKVKEQVTVAYEHVAKAQSQVDKLEPAQGKDQAAQALTAYTKRYETVQQLASQYEKLIAAERALYEQLKVEQTNLKQLQQAVRERNQQWTQVNQLKQQFNQYTEQFNTNKDAFYKAAGIQTDKANSSK
ncbi:YkyA family protein [Paenibacillus arenosi]|uniref:YkyA family protein n=1 Tax=Paenibacillus arenosi TaxID=2774142 RepID=A0ABR9AXN9_9BACL|nr:YkyA family protein [Paenibacillus arenosi]MBD8498409.1 YkyA family protein [Paenibacillus arenosi]